LYRPVIAFVLLGIILLAGCWAPPIGTINLPHLPGWMWGPFGLLGGIIGIALYFLPTIIAIVRKKDNLLLILLLNIFLGWTLVGWIVALVLALL
jgi:Superinfection immunity protein